jgi:AcrR family transcriptional regulator
MPEPIGEPIALPMLTGRPERADAAANRLAILKAAERLLARDGPDGVSIDAVAAAAGVGKGTVFRRFGDRAGLMSALVNGYMRGFQDAFLTGPPPLGPGGDPGERLEAFFVELVRLQRAHLPMALAADLTAGSAESRVYGSLLLHVRTLVHAVDSSADADVVAAMLLGAVAPGVINRLSAARRDDLDLLEASVRALLRGLT